MMKPTLCAHTYREMHTMSKEPEQCTAYFFFSSAWVVLKINTVKMRNGPQQMCSVFKCVRVSASVSMSTPARWINSSSPEAPAFSRGLHYMRGDLW